MLSVLHLCSVPDLGGYAHASGIVGLQNDASSGFWIMHTIPHFPAVGPYSGYGEPAMCTLATNHAGLNVV